MKRALKRAVMREICKKCKTKPVAINYRKGDKICYRSVCDHCSRGYKETRPLWALSGYSKKNSCDKCGHSSRFPEQFDVYYIDNDLTNNRYTNLKTVCANCQRVLHREGVRWKQGDLKPDF